MSLIANTNAMHIVRLVIILYCERVIVDFSSIRANYDANHDN